MIPDPLKVGRKTFQRAVQRAEAAGCRLLAMDDGPLAEMKPMGAIEWANYMYDAARVPRVFEGWAFAWVEGGATVHA
jgi:hypothetical protein